MTTRTSPGGKRGLPPGGSSGRVIVPTLLEVEVYLTNRCNLACSYCSARHVIRERDASRLDGSQLRRAVDLLAADTEVRRRYGGRVRLTFKGGEPLLEFGAMKEAIDRVRDRRLGFELALTTNGTLLTPERMDYLARNGVEVCVSIDGYKEVNDLHRKFKGADGRSVYDSVMGNLRKLMGDARYRRRIHIGTTFTADTIDSAPAVAEFFSRRLGFRQLKIGIEVYGIWGRAGIAALRRALREFKARFLASLPAAAAEGRVEELISEVQFSQYMRNLPDVRDGGASLNELAANPLALFYDGAFYPCDLALKPPLEPEYRVGDLERGLDFRRFDELCALPRFADLSRECAYPSGLLSPAERCCWGLVNGYGPARMARLLQNTSEVNEVFEREMGSYVRIQRICEQLFMKPGFGDFAHEPKYRGPREVRSLRVSAAPGADIVRMRASADYMLHSPGGPKALTVDASAGGAALDLAEALALYSEVKARCLGRGLLVTVRAPRGAADAPRRRHLAALGARLEETCPV
ncbi:MAG: radical SAM protein [Elusimicrobiales bacterium]|nr:radical SAM protein [Elusimicrobiales bacterium]